MKILVTGGAGYIGSHTVLALVEQGHEVQVLDNFSNSSPKVMERLEALAGVGIPLHELDLRDETALLGLFTGQHFDAVIHFAGLKAVGESVSKPLDYYSNNLTGTLCLLRAMAAGDCFHLVFSSSATVYGEQAPLPYTEGFEPLDPNSPYGRTKMMIERILTDLAASDDRWNIALLRYFNPVGAHTSGRIGEDPFGTPNNLTPYIAQVAVGRRECLTVFGDDYPTADGTPLRDYIHVLDLADGHVAAVAHIAGEAFSGAREWNLGTGSGTSVFEVIAAFETATEVKIPIEIGERRAGDVPEMAAAVSRARDELGWVAKRSLHDAFVDLWRWQSNNPHGFNG